MTEINASNLRLSKERVKRIGHDVTGRISDDAAIQVAIRIEVQTRRVWEMANRLAKHDGRKTIQEEDVILAYELMDMELVE